MQCMFEISSQLIFKKLKSGDCEAYSKPLFFFVIKYLMVDIKDVSYWCRWNIQHLFIFTHCWTGFCCCWIHYILHPHPLLVELTATHQQSIAKPIFCLIAGKQFFSSRVSLCKYIFIFYSQKFNTDDICYRQNSNHKPEKLEVSEYLFISGTPSPG